MTAGSLLSAAKTYNVPYDAFRESTLVHVNTWARATFTTDSHGTSTAFSSLRCGPSFTQRRPKSEKRSFADINRLADTGGGMVVLPPRWRRLEAPRRNFYAGRGQHR